jgi:2-phospho-L-lactate guanylyltransferase
MTDVHRIIADQPVVDDGPAPDDRPVGWVVVVPVKGTALAKSRLEVSHQRRAELARAFALDTVAAAVAAEAVTAVLVVTASDSVADAVRPLGVSTVREDGTAGLNPSIVLALSVAQRDYAGAPVAVLLGDLPALHPEELDVALGAARAHSLSMVADAAGVGTVLVCALDAADHSVRFGGASRAAHREAGYVDLTITAPSGLRRDIDTVDDLKSASALPLGAHTRRVLAAAVRA